MKHFFIVMACSIIGFTGRAQYKLSDFFEYIPAVEAKVDSVFNKLDDQNRVAQMIMLAAGRLGQADEHVLKMVTEGKCGGILLLNGTKPDFIARTTKYNALSKEKGHLPLIYSADAEPSLINYKIKETTKVPNASAHTSRKQVEETAKIIARELKEIGIQLNFAPVIDISTNNEAIGNRSFGNHPDTVVAWSAVFTKALQQEMIAATIKHFPGHGKVKGDTHKQLVYIDGEMTEVPNYIPLIEQGAVAVMVGHIAVRNNEKYDTKGLPATVSPLIVTQLLRQELKFKGLVVTDAMNMGGVSQIADRMVMAVAAGCDILLMPKNEDETIKAIVKAMNENPEFKERVYDSVKRIIRLKIILGMI